MGWRTAHYQRRCFRHRHPSNECNHGRRERSAQRIDSQQLASRLLMEANGAIDEGALKSVFGSASPHRALRVMLRIKRLKQREEDLFRGEKVKPHILFPRRVKIREHKKDKKERNVHHLTPESRKGQPFYGDNRHNFLLIKIFRHDALHKVFGVRTWEEIIVLLSRCVAAVHNLDISTMLDLVQHGFKRSDRRKARRALRNLQLGFYPGIHPGVFLAFLSSEFVFTRVLSCERKI